MLPEHPAMHFAQLRVFVSARNNNGTQANVPLK